MSSDSVSSINEELLKKVKSGDLEEVQKLLNEGVDVHYNRDQAIVLASENGDLEMIKLLIQKGADINAQYGAPITASVDGGFLNIVKYLIENGADLEINNYNDLYLAAERDDLNMLQYFLEEEKSVESYDGYIQILKDIFMEAIRNQNNDMIKYMVEEQQVDIHAEDDEAMYLALKNFDVATVNYLINQADIQDVSYPIDNLIRLRTIVENSLSAREAKTLKRMFPWGITVQTDNRAEEVSENADGEEASGSEEEYQDDDGWVSPWRNTTPTQAFFSEEEGDNQEDKPDTTLSKSDYEEDTHLDKGYEYKSDDESVDDPVVLKEGENEIDKIKTICRNDTSVITLEEYDNLNDLYTIYRQNREGEFFEKGECGTKSELRDYLNSDIDQEIPSFFMAIGNTPKLQRDLLTGFTSKPTGKIVVRLPNDMYVTLNSVKKILKEKNHTKWFALPLYSGKRRRIVNLKGFYGIGNNHGQIPGFIVYKLFTGSEIKNKVIVREGTEDFPSFYLHDMMEPLFVILEKYSTPVQKFINNVIKDTTKIL